MAQARGWLETLARRQRTALWAGIAVFFVGISAACLWKYAQYGYDGIDLAIFDQVFWNTLHGRPFSQSIHPHSYLGDHAGLVILPLLPLYAVLPDPRTLLVLQAAALALAAWPLWKLAAHRFSGRSDLPGRLFPLVIAFAWLLNPLVHNIAFYEFHLLPFAIPLLFFAMLSYEQGAFSRFMAFSIAAMVVREDVSLFVAGIGVLALAQRRPWRWRIAPVLAGAAWFLGSMRLIAAFAPDGGYKFLIYYSWLGDSLPSVLAGIVLHPLKVAGHLLTLGNLELVMGLGLPLLFFPYLAPSHLIPAVGPLLPLVLGSAGGSAVVLETHYTALLLPAFFCAAVAAFAKELPGNGRLRRMFGPLPPAAPLAVLAIAAVYAFAVMGPVPPLVARMTDKSMAARTAAADAVMSNIPDNGAVAASYALLPGLSTRRRLFSLHYLYLGSTQFGISPYPPPNDLRYIAVEEADFLTYRVQMRHTAWSKPMYEGGDRRLAAIGGYPVFGRDGFLLIDRLADGPARFSVSSPGTVESRDEAGTGLALSEIAFGRVEYAAGPEDAVRMTFDGDPDAAPDATLRFRVKDTATGSVLLEREMPFLNAFLTEKTGDGRSVRTLHVPLSGLPSGDHAVELDVLDEDGALVLDGIRSTTRLLEKSEVIGGWTVSGLRVP